MPIEVSNANRIVFPEIGRTKGDVVAYYERIAPRLLPHVAGRPLSIRRFPKGLSAPGFFQKNVPPHYPESITRHSVPRQPTKTRKEAVTVYPLLRELEHVPYLANQGAIELHVPMARADAAFRPDRLVIDLDPPPGGAARARRAALIVRDALGDLGLESAPMATGSKGYHVVCALAPRVAGEVVAGAAQKLATLLTARHGDDLTLAFRVANRGERVFVDWMRNMPLATVIAPWSLRARPRATVATPLSWTEVETTAPDAFSITDVDRLLERPDTLAELERAPGDGERFVSAVDAAFEASGLVLQRFDRFRS